MMTAYHLSSWLSQLFGYVIINFLLFVLAQLFAVDNTYMHVLRKRSFPISLSARTVREPILLALEHFSSISTVLYTSPRLAVLGDG